MQLLCMKSRILIVDHTMVIDQSLIAILEEQGHSVEVISNISNPQHLLTVPYDIIFLALTDSTSDDVTFLRHYQEQGHNCYIVIITDYDWFINATHTLHLSTYDYLLKPVEPIMFCSVLKRAMEHQQLDYALKQLNAFETIARKALSIRHEISNPLAVILGLIQLHLDDTSNMELYQDLETINRSIQRINEALQHLSELRKLIIPELDMRTSEMLVLGDQSSTAT